MDHGTESYFAQKAQSARRVAWLSVAAGGVLWSVLFLGLLPPVRRAAREIPVLRFGFQGPARYVELLQFEAVPGPVEPLSDVGHVVAIPTRRGGGGADAEIGAPQPGGSRRREGPRGPGEDVRDVVADARPMRGNLPVFQSEELVLEHLVRPQYPEEMHERGIEGRVSVLARVDTLGRVVEAVVSHSSGEYPLDAASRRAVLGCRFRPYRVDGLAQEVYAEFHFSFRIY